MTQVQPTVDELLARIEQLEKGGVPIQAQPGYDESAGAAARRAEQAVTAQKERHAADADENRFGTHVHAYNPDVQRKGQYVAVGAESIDNGPGDSWLVDPATGLITTRIKES